MKKRSMKRVALLAVAFVAVLTVVFAFTSKKDAKAFDLFDSSKTSIKKCAITLENDNFEWTGKAIKPQVTVNYMGTELVPGVDYVLSYRNNVDAGTAYVKVTGKGNYKSSDKVSFNIVGINFRECSIIATKDKVEVWYQGAKLQEGKDYYLNDGLKQERLTESISTGTGYLNTYEVTKYITIAGRGKYSGGTTKIVTYTTQRFE